MRFPLHRAGYVMSILLAAPAVSLAADSPEPPSIKKPAAEYADPKATYRAYIEAVRNNNAKAATDCWTIDDDNTSGALDTFVGKSIAWRLFKQLAEKNFGVDVFEVHYGVRDFSDAALELTEKRLDGAEVVITGDDATLMIKWEEADAYPPIPAFEWRLAPTRFRKVRGDWKIDANKMIGVKRGADYFENEKSWGRIYRDEVVVLNEAIDAMKNGKLKSIEQLGDFVTDRLKAKRKQFAEALQKDSPKSR